MDEEKDNSQRFNIDTPNFGITVYHNIQEVHLVTHYSKDKVVFRSSDVLELIKLLEAASVATIPF